LKTKCHFYQINGIKEQKIPLQKDIAQHKEIKISSLIVENKQLYKFRELPNPHR
jgi:hypothetical protein